MPRRCGLCRRAPREDDNLSTVQADGIGTVAACSPCRAIVLGQLPPAVRCYPPGEPVPRAAGRDSDIRVCGVCRAALFEDDTGTAIRLAAEDVAGDPWPVEPGCYMACRECLERYTPRIRKRLGKWTEDMSTPLAPYDLL